jgi:hypothetical protein
MGSPQCVSAYVGNPWAYVDVVDGVAGPPRLRREPLPVSEPAADAAGTDGVRDENPDSDGSTLSGTLAAALTLLRISYADNRVSGAAGRLLRLLRELEVVVLLLVLVLRELATLGLVMRELVTLAVPSPSWS